MTEVFFFFLFNLFIFVGREVCAWKHLSFVFDLCLILLLLLLLLLVLLLFFHLANHLDSTISCMNIRLDQQVAVPPFTRLHNNPDLNSLMLSLQPSSMHSGLYRLCCMSYRLIFSPLYLYNCPIAVHLCSMLSTCVFEHKLAFEFDVSRVLLD